MIPLNQAPPVPGTRRAILLIFCAILLLMAVPASGQASSAKTQKLFIGFRNAAVLAAFDKIESASDLRFSYNRDDINPNKKITLQPKERTVADLLSEVSRQAGLEFSYSDDLVMVRPERRTRAVVKNEKPDDINLTGKVTSSKGEPLPGVTIKVRGQNIGTVTDEAGNFSISVPDTAVLIVSYIGYETKEVPVKGHTALNIVLQTASSGLNEIVVIGYGTQKKRDLTGSIAVINGDEVAKMPASNPVASLQGKVAGLTIVNSGQAGASPTVRIRGVNSTNNADPLYVVDGILQTNIDYLNPADIQTIEVLKDPSSIAIYGLQGGNGVIIITTKRAQKGQTIVNFQTNIGLQQVNNRIKEADAAGFKKLYSAQLANLGATPFDYTNYTANTNWQDQVLRTALLSNNTLSISSGGDKTSTYFNLGYSNQQGVEKFDAYQKYIARLNEEIQVSKSIRIGGDLTGYYWKQNPPGATTIQEALWAAPIVPVKAGPGLYYSMPSFQRAQVGNPVAYIDGHNGNTLNSGYRVTGNLFAEIKFLKDFTWRSAFYTDLGFNNSRGYTPLPYHYIDLGEGNTPTDTSYALNPHTSVNQAQTVYKTYQQDHTLTYDKDLAGGHHITAMAGFSTLYHYMEGINGSRTDTSLNIPNNPNFWYLGVAQQSNPGTFGGSAAEDASTSFMARVNYSYQGRYLLNLTYRRDGTSKFSPNYQWGNFGSVGAGWIMTEEDFMHNIGWLDFLKLKASWGTVGNGLNIGNYLSYPALNNANVGIFGNNVYPAVAAAYVPDPHLHWETVEGKDAGFESRLLGNRLSLDVDLYDRKTHDILTTITLPGASGNTDYFTNLGTIDNKGVEVTAGWNDKIGKDFSYSVSGNFSYNTNKVVSIGNNINFQIVGNGGVNLTQSGYSIGYFYGYEQTGIYQTTAQLDKTAHMSSAAPGDISYRDVNGDGKIDQNDRTYLGTPFPKYNFGGDISLGYKNFDFEIDLQGVAGNKIYVQRRSYTFAILNYEANRLRAWTGAGTTNIEPILDNTRSNNYLFSSYWLEPGDYLRIRTLQLGYTFNFRTPSNTGIKALRLYLSGQNLATFTKATGYSPEVPISNPVSAGADNGVYPLPAVYSFGLNATF